LPATFEKLRCHRKPNGLAEALGSIPRDVIITLLLLLAIKAGHAQLNSPQHPPTPMSKTA
jgi:hypothetical protein